MRKFSIAACVLLLMLWLGCVVEFPSITMTLPDSCRWAAPLPEDDWRRTVHGWERTSTWTQPDTTSVPKASRLHPAVVASIQMLASLGSLIAFPVSQRSKARRS